MRKNTTISLPPGAAKALRRVAEFHGFTATRGLAVGMGSISELMASIASGETVTVLIDDEPRAQLLEWLKRQHEALKPQSIEEMALEEALRALIRCLEFADERSA